MRSASGVFPEVKCSAHHYGKTPLLLLHRSLTEPLFGTAAGRKREERFETKNSCGKPWLRHADAFPHYLFDGVTRSVTPPKRGK